MKWVFAGACLFCLSLFSLSGVLIQQAGPAAPTAPISCRGKTADPLCLLSAQQQRIAQTARTIVAHLHGSPDVWYDGQIPAAVLQYWQQVCPLVDGNPALGCFPNWQNGNLQCVLFVTGVFALAGSPLPASGNAVDFWELYAHRPGWMEIPSGAAPPGARGLPMAGDIMVWWTPPPAVGHVAIVLEVQPPQGTQNGSVTFAQANGPGTVIGKTFVPGMTTHVLTPDLRVETWTSPLPYLVLGYIRPVQERPQNTPGPHTAGRHP